MPATIQQMVQGRFVCAVAQQMFDTATGEFCRLMPIWKIGFGEITPDMAEEYFPNFGLIWWMLNTPRAPELAQVGRLVVTGVEPAKQTGKEEFEARQFRPAGVQDGLIEVIDITNDQVIEVRDMVNVQAAATMDHPPTNTVLVRWKDRLYGPLTTTWFEADRDDGSEGDSFEVDLLSPNNSVWTMSWPETVLTNLPASKYRRDFRRELSLSSERPGESRNKREFTYNLLTTEGYQEVVRNTANAKRVAMYDDRAAVRYFTTHMDIAPEASRLLAAIDRATRENGGRVIPSLDGDANEIAKSVMRHLEEDRTVAPKVAEKLKLDQRTINTLIAPEVEKYKTQHAAELTSEIDRLLSTRHEELAAVSKRIDTIENEIQARNAKNDAERKELHQQEDERRLSEWAVREREVIEKERAFSGYEVALESIRAATAEFQSQSKGMMQDFFRLWPFLQLANPTSKMPAEAGASPPSIRILDAPLTFPAFVTEVRKDDVVPEAEFFRRFKTHVEDSGYVYRIADLEAFHLSMKCSSLTILAGMSGTGKSSLPRLYAEALAGESIPDIGAESRWLNVAVRPSWLDMTDLLGHVNGLTRTFESAESGLYRFLVWAEEEYRWAQDASGIYLVCLDEMNLSHVEHYFSGFLQALELPAGLQHVRCFDPASVSSESPFAKWSTLKLPPTLRFVGTVNRDETTKPLSVRLLDRANEIELGSRTLIDDPPKGRNARHSVKGPPVTARAFNAWTANSPKKLDTRLRKIFEQLDAALSKMGRPITPRRSEAIRFAVANVRPDDESEDAEWRSKAEINAFDWQIAQRVIPQLRNVLAFTPQRAINELLAVVNDSQSSELPETRAAFARLQMETTLDA